ncbi:hypothetical protein [Myxococcus qinghaiensis]|uniref:hypothetical protein n=1 Tax=Myxococcus qinghaiensis TaxID=2906758 RepID=UPI0020A726C2|nr:hypothetical protein [Myxococcus qinghaiensis]MCP3163382.1 hypothetical protein [Myxococcus qinghaiensis]
MSFRVGQLVRVMSLPDGLAQLPEESREVFRVCLGGTFPVEEIESDGVLVLNVSQVAVPRFGGHRHIIMVDPTHVVPAE